MPPVKPFPTHLITQWHPTKNGDLTPADVSAGSKKRAWWICEKGHEWDAVIDSRAIRGNGCPYCSGRRVTPGVNDLLTNNPELAAQWHPTKNGNLTPSMVASTTAKKVWWQAEDGHEWQARVVDRAGSTKCPVCAGSYIQQGINDFASQRPDILPYVHPTKNKGFNPEKVAKTSNKNIWWLCEQGHEWKQDIQGMRNCPVCAGRKLVTGVNDLMALHPELGREWDNKKNASPADKITLKNLTSERFWICPEGHSWKTSIQSTLNGKTCVVCSGDKVLTGYNDLLTTHPELVKQWHPTKNTISPDSVSAGSWAEAWWVCEKGHEWKSRIIRRTQMGMGSCSICSNNQVLAGYNDLVTTHPEYVEQWNHEKNSILPTEITAGSSRKIWWKCENEHEWEVSPVSRIVNETGCPYCSNRKFLSGYNDLSTAFPEIAAQWHPTKNDMSPSEIPAGSNKKVWWLCDKGHEWDMIVVIRTSSGQKCPLCSGRRIVPGVNDLSTLRPDIAAQWHPTKNTILPSEVSEQSNRKVWWKCEKEHEWRTSVQRRTFFDNGCPCCRNKKVLAGYNDLATTHPDVAAHWHPTKNGDLLPTMVTYGAHRTAWWICDKGHELEALIPDRSRGIGCRKCTNRFSKGEQELAEFVKSLGFTVIQHDRAMTGNGTEIDIYVPEKNIGIEYNGVYWHSTAVLSDKNVHYKKFTACKDNGVQLIQIWEDEWQDKQELVKNLIAHKLGASSQKRIFARKTEVVEIPYRESEEFLNEHHIQGSAQASRYLALKHEGEVVSVLALRIEGENTVGNIVRYATSHSVIGGFGKLLSHIENTMSLDSVYTFSDNRISDGGLYESLGFTAVKNLYPDYMYVRGAQRHHKFGYRLKRFREDPVLRYEEGLTERELAELNNIPRLYDAGKVKWEKKL